MCGVFPNIKGIWWPYFFAYKQAYIDVCVFANSSLPNQDIAQFSRQQYQVSIPKLATQHNSARSAFPIGNSTQQRQVGIHKSATQHNSARSAFPNCQLSSTILPNCQVHFTAVDCPNELQAAHNLYILSSILKSKYKNVNLIEFFFPSFLVIETLTTHFILKFPQ